MGALKILRLTALVMFIVGLSLALYAYSEGSAVVKKANSGPELVVCGNVLCTPAQKYGDIVGYYENLQAEGVALGAVGWLLFARPDLLPRGGWEKIWKRLGENPLGE